MKAPQGRCTGADFFAAQQCLASVRLALRGGDGDGVPGDFVKKLGIFNEKS